MRYWSDAEVNYASDSEPAVIVTGAPETRMAVISMHWRIENKRDDGAIIWRLNYGKTLERTKKPVDESLRHVLNDTLEGVNPVGLHPALENGLKSDAMRLYPGMNPKSLPFFENFVDYLGQEFGLTDDIWADEPLVPFVDDFGPEMLVYSDGTAIVLPEVPPVYQAPLDWQRAMWWVSNNMFGPILWNEVENEDKLVFNNIDIPEDAKTPLFEGLVYYHGLRASLAADAWRGTTTTDLMRGFVALVEKLGFRPWQHPRTIDPEA